MPKSRLESEETPALPANSARQRNLTRKPKKDPVSALPSTPGYQATDFVDPVMSKISAEGLIARIHELEDRLNQQATMLAERCAEIVALKTENDAVASLRSCIREQEELIQSKGIALSEIEQSFAAEILRAQAQKQTLASRELELEQLKGLLQGPKTTVLPSQNTLHWITAETERLIAEQREARLGLAKLEMDEWCTIRRRNAWNRLVAAMHHWFAKNTSPRKPAQ